MSQVMDLLAELERGYTRAGAGGGMNLPSDFVHNLVRAYRAEKERLSGVVPSLRDEVEAALRSAIRAGEGAAAETFYRLMKAMEDKSNG